MEISIDASNALLKYDPAMTQVYAQYPLLGKGTKSNKLRLDSLSVIGSYTTAARDAIVGVSNSMIIYNTTADKFQGRAAGAWVDLH